MIATADVDMDRRMRRAERTIIDWSGRAGAEMLTLSATRVMRAAGAG